MSFRGYIWCAITIFDVVAWYLIIKTVHGLYQLCPCIAVI